MSYSPEAVFNQPPPLEDYNLFESDCALQEAVHGEGGGWIDAEARKFGEILGSRKRSIWGCWPIGLHRNCEPTIVSVFESTR